jgi:zinc transporter ZupT
MDSSLIQASLLLVGVALLGALLPLLGSWSDKHLHVLLSVAAGVFLGALFLELLPELAGSHAGHGQGDHAGTAGRLPWAAALLGMLLLFFLEHIWLRERVADKGGHLVVWLGTFVGLTVHSFVVGLGLSTLADRPESMQPLILAIAIHKTAEGFSLATVIRLAELRITRAWTFIGIFSIASPLGLAVGSRLHGVGGDTSSWASILEGLAAGTFLYVAAYNLLPEVFHGREQRGARVFGLLGGLGVFALTIYWTH